MASRVTTKTRATTKGGKPSAKLSRRQLAWLRAAGRVVAAVERMPRIDAGAFASIVATLKATEATGQAERRNYYVSLRGARGVAKVEATLKGG